MELTIPYARLPVADFDELQTRLYTAAQEALGLAYAPYSNFLVACAIGFEGGHVVTGNNQENAAYPSGLCAERVALFKGKSESRAAIDTLLVMAQNDQGVLCETFPCGACRQVMLEYAGQQATPIKILMQADSNSFLVVDDVRHLLPFSFTKDSL
ncbi:MAG: cytidine deaminase [Bacteroidota bacterium]